MKGTILLDEWTRGRGIANEIDAGRVTEGLEGCRVFLVVAEDEKGC